MMKLLYSHRSSTPFRHSPDPTQRRRLNQRSGPGTKSHARLPANRTTEGASDRRECGSLDGGCLRELYALRPEEKRTSPQGLCCFPWSATSVSLHVIEGTRAGSLNVVESQGQRHGAVAQWSEQGTHNPSVAGSIPACPTKVTVGPGRPPTPQLTDVAVLADLSPGQEGHRPHARGDRSAHAFCEPRALSEAGPRTIADPKTDRAANQSSLEMDSACSPSTAT